MTTVIILTIYCVGAIVRHVKGGRERKLRELMDGARDAEMKILKAKVAAIEEAISHSPFIHYKQN